MSKRKSRRDLLSEQLTLAQQKAVYNLLDNEMLPTAERKTQEELATEVGVDRITLYRWRKQNQAFIEFKKEVAKDFLGDAVGIFASQLIASMEGKQPSQKALDLYAKMMGFVKSDNTVDINVGGAKTNADMQAELEALDEQLAELDADEKEGD